MFTFMTCYFLDFPFHSHLLGPPFLSSSSCKAASGFSSSFSFLFQFFIYTHYNSLKYYPLADDSPVLISSPYLSLQPSSHSVKNPGVICDSSLSLMPFIQLSGIVPPKTICSLLTTSANTTGSRHSFFASYHFPSPAVYSQKSLSDAFKICHHTIPLLKIFQEICISYKAKALTKSYRICHPNLPCPLPPTFTLLSH